MAHLSTGVSVLGSAFAIVFAFGCTDNAAGEQDEGSVEQASHGHTQIHTEDDCDPVTFGALCRAGFNGHTTIAAFGAELAATQRVAAWEYGGGEIRVNLGDSFRVDNVGGETHTFSVVANFGGGRVPPLNTASGNPVPAPECIAGPNAANVDIASAGGLTVTTGASGVIKAKGTYKVQCCIHPWMRTTVVVN
jgi:plastocyanin